MRLFLRPAVYPRSIVSILRAPLLKLRLMSLGGLHHPVCEISTSQPWSVVDRLVRVGVWANGYLVYRLYRLLRFASACCGRHRRSATWCQVSTSARSCASPAGKSEVVPGGNPSSGGSALTMPGWPGISRDPDMVTFGPFSNGSILLKPIHSGLRSSSKMMRRSDLPLGFILLMTPPIVETVSCIDAASVNPSRSSKDSASSTTNGVGTCVSSGTVAGKRRLWIHISSATLRVQIFRQASDSPSICGGYCCRPAPVP